ncbi:MAG: DeoR/GlpR transcriptional regulator [Firmicutes bacterium]|nr:DeoR/GlpR transcriptional regulator [Bacillota bacterium]
MIPKKERLLRIKERLAEEDYVSSKELAEDFKVSEVTIRKDLSELADLKHIERTFGGAVLCDTAEQEFSIDHKNILTAFRNMPSQTLKKYKLLAAKALEFVEPGDTLFLGSGVTCCIFAELLPKNYNLSVVTNNLSALSSLIEKNINVFLVGGEIATVTGNAYFSSIADPGEYLKSICVNKAFTSCYGIDTSAGITVESIISSYIFKALPNIQEAWHIMVTPEKIGRVGMYKICAIENAERIIYLDIPESFRQHCLEKGVALTKAV